MIDVLAFRCSICSEAAVRASLFSPLNPLVRLVVALVVGMSFDVDKNHTSLAPFVLPLEGLVADAKTTSVARNHNGAALARSSSKASRILVKLVLKSARIMHG